MRIPNKLLYTVDRECVSVCIPRFFIILHTTLKCLLSILQVVGQCLLAYMTVHNFGHFTSKQMTYVALFF